MLKDYLNNKDGKKNIVLIIGILIVLVFVCLSGGTGGIDGYIVSDADANITKLLENITNNYSVKITKDDGLEQTSYNYSTDSNLTVIDEGDYSDKIYLVYKNNKYQMNIDNHKITKIKDIESLNDKYTNIELIKNVVNRCEFENVNDNNKECNLNSKDFFDEYNSIYKTEYVPNEDEIKINVIYYSKNIKNIIIDYTNVDKIIYKNDGTLKYSFEFSDINKNDYSEIINYYKKDFSKK
jgi:hypothetical protein